MSSSTPLKGMWVEGSDNAVAAALAAAEAAFGPEAGMIHVQFVGLERNGDLYRAVLRVVWEPLNDVKDEDEPAPHKKPAPAPEEDDREERKRHRDRLDLDDLDEMRDEMEMHVYMPEEEDGDILYNPHYYHDSPHIIFHLMDRGSSEWETSMRLHPELDLYKATHPEPAPAKHAHAVDEPAPRPSRKNDRRLELND